jgi:transcriptional regulator with XRE-family HTH domain
MAACRLTRHRPCRVKVCSLTADGRLAEWTILGVRRCDVVADRFDLVARNVRRLRHERGYSISELARRASLAKQTLASIEAGEANPTVLTLTGIAAALEIPVAHLLTEYGSPVRVRRAQDASWTDSPDGGVRELDRIYGFGYVRTTLIRHARGTGPRIAHRRHRPGTLHHAYVVTGKVSLGPTGEEVTVSRGDFVRFPGDVPHQTLVLSDTVVIHMVTTVPHVSQLGHRPR